MNLFWFNVFAATNNTFFINVIFVVTRLEANKFSTMLYAHTRKIFTATFAPFENCFFKTFKLFCGFDVFFEIIHLTANGAIYAMTTNQYSHTQVQTITKCFLP